MAGSFAWESMAWRQGADEYRFDIERGGLFGTMIAPGGRRLTLPMVAWEGLLDGLRAHRSTKARAEQPFPARSRSRWYDGEVAELVEGFRSGRSIVALARAHNRSEYAIEKELDKLGLISTAEKYGPGSGFGGGRGGGWAAPAQEAAGSGAGELGAWPEAAGDGETAGGEPRQRSTGDRNLTTT